jgi:hypothetical protein
MEPKIRLLHGDKASKPYTVDELYRMAVAGEIDQTTQFWSKRNKGWASLPGLMCDLYPPQLKGLRSAGIQRVKVINSGTGEDCPACSALAGQVFPIEHAPELPPAGCRCIPWCRCVIGATV